MDSDRVEQIGARGSQMRATTFEGEVDFQRMAKLLSAIRDAEGDHWPSSFHLRILLQSPAFLPQWHTQFWEDAAGQLVAFSLIAENSPVIAIHPAVRTELLEGEILKWAISRSRSVARERGDVTPIHIAVRADDMLRDNLLRRLGFLPIADRVQRMTRPLAGELTEPGVPQGFAIRSLNGVSDLEDYSRLYYESFSSSSSTNVRALPRLSTEGNLPELNLVGIDPNGKLAGFCLCSMGQEERRYPGRGEGWIDLVGTHPDVRRNGLGRALLVAGLHELQRVGAASAILSVGSTSPALHFYGSAGFKRAYDVLLYIEPMRVI